MGICCLSFSIAPIPRVVVLVPVPTVPFATSKPASSYVGPRVSFGVNKFLIAVVLPSLNGDESLNPPRPSCGPAPPIVLNN